jgi:AICAR transformylase/IMP cyclohydrolase PurH
MRPHFSLVRNRAADEYGMVMAFTGLRLFHH